MNLLLAAFMLTAQAQDLVNAGDEDGFPTAVALGAEWNGNAFSACTGSLITPDVILTAAHCSADLPIEAIITLGLAFFGPSVYDPDFTMGFDDAVVHPDYEQLQGDDLGHDDMALLFLSESVDVEPIWFREAGMDEDLVGEPVTSVGFGVTSSAGAGSGYKRSAELIIDEIDETFLVSNSYSNDDSAQVCSGDSGGPMYHLSDGVWTQWAVHSWADESCQYMSGSTRTDPVSEWILDELEEFYGTRDRCEMWGLYDDDVCDAECADDPACAVDGDEEPKLVGCGCSIQQTPGPAPIWPCLLVGLIGLRRRA